MAIRRPAVGALLALIGVVTVAVAGDSSGGIQWIERKSEALERAAASSKPLLVDFWAVWCVPCREMEKTTYRDGRVLRAVEAFVPLKIDADADEAFVARYGVESYPTTLFLDQEGREITRLAGLIRTERLLDVMDVVASGYGNYVGSRRAARDPVALEATGDYLARAGNVEGGAQRFEAALKASPRDHPRREMIAVKLGESLVESGRAGAAVKRLAPLTTSAEPEIRGRALVGLVQAERSRGRDDRAGDALDRLRDEFPELAAELER